MGHGLTIPLLLYHKLGDSPRGRVVPGHYVSARLFRRQLAFLRARGYQSVPLTAFLDPTRDLPAKPVVITFDDGYRGLHQHGLPILAEQGFSATIFMVAGGVDRGNYWEEAVGDVAEAMLSNAGDTGDAAGRNGLRLPHPQPPSPDGALGRGSETGTAGVAGALGRPARRALRHPRLSLWRLERERTRGLPRRPAISSPARPCGRPARLEDDRLTLPRINVRRYNVIPRFAYKLWRAKRVQA